MEGQVVTDATLADFRYARKRGSAGDLPLNARMGIGDRIRAEREAAGLSQGALGKLAGLSQRTISDLETGNHKGSTKLHHVADTLGVSLRWLETGRGPKHLNGTALAQGREQASQPSRPDPDILHEAMALLLFDLDHGGPRSARSATSLLLDLYDRIAAAGGRLSDEDQERFEQQARSRGEQGVVQHERKAGRHR